MYKILEVKDGWIVRRGNTDIFFSPFHRDCMQFVNYGDIIDYDCDHLIISNSSDIWELFEFRNKEIPNEVITYFTSSDKEKVFQKAIELIYSGKFRYVVFFYESEEDELN